jgi:cystathionine beta-lyase/cystathionine gamma-synthase
MDHLANKIAYMEGIDLIRSNPDVEPTELVMGKVTSSGMAATSAAVLAKMRAGDKAIVHRVCMAIASNGGISLLRA